MEYLKNNFFTIAIVLLVILSASASYYRFMVNHDYMLTFEGYCEPEYDSCFWNEYLDTEECESDNPDDCWVEYYYRLVEKPYSTFERQMSECTDVTFFETDEDGNVVLDDFERPVFFDPSYCELVDTCEPEEDNCLITYCDASDSNNECNKNYNP